MGMHNPRLLDPTMKRLQKATNAAALFSLLLLGLATFGLHTWQHMRWEVRGSAHQAYHADGHAHVGQHPSTAAASELVPESSTSVIPASRHELLPEHADVADACLVCILHGPSQTPISTASAPFQGDLRVSVAETDVPPSHNLGPPDIRGPPVTG